MKPVRIYNSLTRNKDVFTPLHPGAVGMYVCGPTVYDEPHIGHARSAYIFDVIRRYLAFKGYRVTFVRNVTDVDDKIIEKAKAIVGSQPLAPGLKNAANEVAQKYLDAYHAAMARLGIGSPDREPKATEYIPKMIGFIELLIVRGAAYAAGGDVYFDITKTKRYGKLSNQNLEHMESGARVAPGEHKRNGLDFALWKKAKEGEPSWPSPWGAGRPGWHIECSAMSSDILGDEFDIHGGGIDLIFPHHENEIAQSEGAGKPFARYWIHNGLLTINSEKMAKSLGNFITIDDFMGRYTDPDLMKLFFLSAHYRSPIDYTAERIEEARKEKERFSILLHKIERVAAAAGREAKGDAGEPLREEFEAAMDDDFNTPLALAALFDLVTEANKLMHGRDAFSTDEAARLVRMRSALITMSGVFGLDLAHTVSEGNADAAAVERLVTERNAARAAKDFRKADEIRAKLAAMNVILEDTKDGTTWRVKI